MNFRKNIKVYNSMFAFTSMGAELTYQSIFQRKLEKGNNLHIYIYNTNNEIENRIKNEHNVLVKSFHMARDKYREQPQEVLCMGLLFERGKDG
ncbi:hypothetical protein H5410_022136 [Solanum commersonii]|uniref:Uncharacterized protein n=1 Tax=Solanum commersonii TaxID=4109 RepID=A0A9J5ZFW6_SOLCO|nr:hypothetical protein H5410_022136 [Solanum commersonii]